MTTPQPFTIAVPPDDLDDLRRRVQSTRWPEEQEGVGSEQGLPLGRARELASAWIDDFDWRAVEATLNELGHVHTVAEGAHVHAVHRRAASADAPALVLLHGWPGSFFEFHRLIEPLGEDFHLVVPSLPGFGFSGATPGTGWGARRMASAIAGLMSQLGYERYFVHGTDWGAATGRWLSIDQADRVARFHTCGAVGLPDPDATLSDEEQRRAKGREQYMYNHSGYAMEQAQRPMTLGYSLTDSAVGQLAWVAEKLVDWADPETPIDRDAILTTASIYWFTATGTTSARAYWEGGRDGSWYVPPEPSPTDTAVAVFPGGALPNTSIRPFAERVHPIVRWTEFERGGHFPALEVPELLLADLRETFLG